ncbi:unnamed protein product [Arabidopsis lyrata]|nr:unnamed protein product [Arabidopsis lyrata]
MIMRCYNISKFINSPRELVKRCSMSVTRKEDAHKKRGNEFSGASSSRCGWLVFDRGNKNRISGDVMNIVFSVLDLKKCFLQGGCSENKKRGNAFRGIKEAEEEHLLLSPVNSCVSTYTVTHESGVARWVAQE